MPDSNLNRIFFVIGVPNSPTSCQNVLAIPFIENAKLLPTKSALVKQGTILSIGEIKHKAKVLLSTNPDLLNLFIDRNSLVLGLLPKNGLIKQLLASVAHQFQNILNQRTGSSSKAPIDFVLDGTSKLPDFLRKSRNGSYDLAWIYLSSCMTLSEWIHFLHTQLNHDIRPNSTFTLEALFKAWVLELTSWNVSLEYNPFTPYSLQPYQLGTLHRHYHKPQILIPP